jgi:hypothetical protein
VQRVRVPVLHIAGLSVENVLFRARYSLPKFGAFVFALTPDAGQGRLEVFVHDTPLLWLVRVKDARLSALAKRVATSLAAS